MLLKVGPGAVFVKRDLADAFGHIPVSTSDLVALGISAIKSTMSTCREAGRRESAIAGTRTLVLRWRVLALMIVLRLILLDSTIISALFL